MTLSELSIKRPVFAWMLMLGLIFFGWIAFTRMGVSQLPDVDFPVVNVSLTYTGAAPEVMETDIVDVVEDAIMTVQGIKTVTSTSKYGNANVSIEFELDRDIDVAMQEVQTKIVQAQRNLPREMEPPVITKTNPEDQPILWLSLNSDRHSRVELMHYVRDQLKDKFSTVPGVGEVTLGGYIEPNLRVWVSSAKLRQYELTAGDVIGTVESQHIELPAGQIATDKIEYDVRAIGEAKTATEFGQLLVTDRGGRPNYAKIRLSDIATVEEGLDEVRRMSRFDGNAAVGLGIKKQRGSNAVDVARATQAKLADIQKFMPEGMRISTTFDTTRFIEESVHGLNFALLMAAILTAVVCLAFLGSWSSTINVLFSIPTSIIGAFIVLNLFGFTLNTFTLLGLSLAVGIVVDDAIMVLENIVRHREMGATRRQAALRGSREITSAAVAATIAIVAIFLPVAFMRGVIGQFFLQFGVTMTVTVLLSLLEALTLTPMRCAKFVEPAHRTTRIGKWIEKLFLASEAKYRRALAWSLGHRWKVVLMAFAFFAASMTSIKWINKEFVPAQDQSNFMMRLQTPVGSSLAFTDKQVQIVEKYLKPKPEIDHVYTAIGGFGGGGEVNTAIFFVTMKPKGKRGVNPTLKHEGTQQEIMDLFRKEIGGIAELKGTKVFLQDLSMRGFSSSRGFPVEFSIRGRDWDQLGKSSGEIMERLEKTGLVADLDSDYKVGKPEIWVRPDRAKAAQMGVSAKVISETISAMIGGVRAGRYAMGSHRYDIRVKIQDEGLDRMEQIKNLSVRNNRGELIRLADVVTIEEHKSLQQIVRYDRQRSVTVFANVKPGKSQADALAESEKIAKEVLPEGYNLVFSGSAQTMKESFQDLILALVLGLVVAYMVLASQFNSFLDPVTILLALPFSLSGAFLALWMCGVSLNIFSFIGLILLMGIVKKNSILLVEFTNQVRAGGMKDIKQALLHACPIRLRPIIMTSFACIAAAVPEALPIAAGHETRVPMAVTVIGGVLVSTVLTLIVIPCVYSLLSKYRRFDADADKEEDKEIRADELSWVPSGQPVPATLPGLGGSA